MVDERFISSKMAGIINRNRCALNFLKEFAARLTASGNALNCPEKFSKIFNFLPFHMPSKIVLVQGSAD